MSWVDGRVAENGGGDVHAVALADGAHVLGIGRGQGVDHVDRGVDPGLHASHPLSEFPWGWVLNALACSLKSANPFLVRGVLIFSRSTITPYIGCYRLAQSMNS